MKKIIILLFLLLGCSAIPQEISSEPQVFFCPGNDCSQYIIYLIQTSTTSIHCAFYDLGLQEVLDEIDAKNLDVKLLLEKNKLQDTDYIKMDPDKQQMHNKFCVFDNQIILTGSMNPTIRGTTKNNNNIVIVNSKLLAENYEREFQELWKNKQYKTPHPKIILNNKTVETLFCPEDNCADRVIELINQAKERIYFMTFSFTDRNIANAIIEKHNQGLNVKGVIEKIQNSKWSQFNNLNNSGINITQDHNPANMHHKVFIIDNIVITGSYNPTGNGNKHNDENILILHDKEIAEKYVIEFEVLN